ncbi:NADP-specific glutamate dehydrogenase [Achlya hypogyna]|uniref:Glutamate dehydrogenase n=1 Tax=Achlya hypogyna TaxID=1202772 RepID=A0A1V9YGS2_ACHHY|nr:NADP-specific glutamate dehydrogenase [Achlya hypogyna]
MLRRSIGAARRMSETSKPPTLMSDVHGTVHGKKAWRNQPLFRREGDKKFRSGAEAAVMLYEEAARRDPYQTEFLEAVQSFLNSVTPVFDRYPKYAWVMKQLMEPERVIQFRVPWIDDQGSRRVNRGFRVQFSSCCGKLSERGLVMSRFDVVGPYIGGLRFHGECRHGTVKFLAFENIFRNAVYGPFGAAAGGADFSPIDKSEAEIMRFCQSYVTELANYIGPATDIPTGGVNVGPKEMGYMFGQYKRLRQTHPAGVDGVLGGSTFPQVTGYGVAYFAKILVEHAKDSLVGKRVLISGSGTVALSTAEKLLELGAIPIGFSDVWGHVIEPDGFSKAQLQALKEIKAEHSARLGGYIMTSTSAKYFPAEETSFWDHPCDLAFPCAMQNDINDVAAKKLVKNGCKGVFEGAHLPCTPEAIKVFQQHNVLFGPCKATNGAALALHLKGVTLRGGEVDHADMDAIAQECMQKVFKAISATAVEFNCVGNWHMATNITGFLKVAQAMFRQGVV